MLGRTAMAQALALLAVLMALLGAAAAGGGGGFGGGGEGFIRKYAMMKVYESCLGREVVREVQRELRAACQRCSGEAPPASAPGPGPGPAPGGPGAEAGAESEQPGGGPGPGPGPSGPAGPAAALGSLPLSGSKRRKQPTVPFDSVKLQEAILGFRHSQQQQQQHFQHLQPAQPQPQYPGPAGGYYPFYSASAGYYPQPYAAAPAQAAFHGGYPGPQGYPQPGYSQAVYSPPGYYPQAGYYSPPGPGYSSRRSSRDMDLRNQLEMLTSRMGTRTRNATCVLQELGYLDENLEPNYAGIQEKLRQLPVDEDLRRDMLVGVDYCRQFASCVPAQGGRDARKLFRSKFFFQCYKHKKLEACVMKDVREGYDREDAEVRTLGTPDPQDLQDVARDMYEFLSGTGLAEESLM